MIYDTRNRTNLDKLADHTKVAAYKWYNYCINNQIQLLIYETIRTVAQQKQNVANGKSQTMKSYHLVGQALDWVLVDSKGNTLWNAYKTANGMKVINYAKSIGFVSGHDWGWDSPHLQYEHKGYGTDIFGKIKVDKGELTMSQYNELSAKIKELEEQLKNKANIKTDTVVDETHMESWDWAIAQGIIKGDGKSMNPTGALSRQQMATMLKRYHDKYIVK
ncbi:M15 family metallopeptidase [Lysinibacillus sphaericus]|nr:M15 family metallopeptidase [Lysinibacillus sphaericus]